ncbi:MAG: OmpH family outer membrane protein [Bryobacteraceae bacterium]
MRLVNQAASLAATGVFAATLVWGQAAQPSKVGIVNMSAAIVSTNDGQKAVGALQSKFAPKKSEIDKKSSEVEQLKAQLSRGANTMSDEQKQKVMREIDSRTKQLTRETEDAQAELDQEQQKIQSELGQRMFAVIDKYARDNGFSLILDVSSQQSPVLFASDSINITQAVVDIYNKNSPSAVSSSAPPAAIPAAAKPAVPSPATKPVTPAKKPPAAK